jgi:3-oxoadipate enol-lactonase
MTTVSTGVELSCVDCGRGMPLLLVHGFPLDHTMWAQQIDVLSRQCRVIAPDLRGFGGSRRTADDEKITMAQFADDLAALLDGLDIVEPIVFCGLSMGGYIALQFWRQYASRLRGLVLCDTRAAADGPEAVAARRTMADRVLREGPTPQVEALLPRVLGETTRRLRLQVVEGVRRMMLSTSPRSIAAAQRGMAERPDMTDSLGQIACATLVVVGAEDASSPPSEMRAMAQAIPSSQFVEIREAGHLTPLENPAAVNAALAEFLARFV